MAKLRLSSSAKRDLAEIDEHGATQFGGTVADEYARGVFVRLREHPLSGPSRPELGKGVRHVVYGRHLVFYIFADDVVRILRVFHHARDVKSSQFK